MCPKTFLFSLLATIPTPTPEPGWIEKIAERGKVDVPESSGFVGGWTGDVAHAFVEDFKAGLVEILHWIGKGIFDYVGPIINWGGRTIIISCVIIFYCSGERKYISLALKWLIICIIYWTLKGAYGL